MTRKDSRYGDITLQPAQTYTPNPNPRLINSRRAHARLLNQASEGRDYQRTYARMLYPHMEGVAASVVRTIEGSVDCPLDLDMHPEHVY